MGSRFRRNQNNDDDNRKRKPDNPGGRSSGDDKSDDSSSGRRPFGRRGDDDKSSSASTGSSRFGRRSGGDDKPKGDGKSKEDSSSSTGSSRFGRRSTDADSSSSSSSSGSSPFNRGSSTTGSSPFSRGSSSSDDSSSSSSSRRFGSSGTSSGDSSASSSSPTGTGRFGSSGSSSSDSSSSSGGRFGSGGSSSAGKGSDTSSSTGTGRFGSGGSPSSDSSSSSGGRFGSGGSSSAGKGSDTSSSTGTGRFGSGGSSSSDSSSSSGGRFGSRPGNDTSSSSGTGRFGSSGSSSSDSPSSGTGRFGSGGSSSSDSSSSSSGRFGSSGGSTRSDSTTGSSRLGNRPSTTSTTPDSSASGGRTFGRTGTTPSSSDEPSGGRVFGGSGSRGSDDKSTDKSSGGGRFGRGGSTDTKTDDKSAGGRFGRGGSTDTKTADKSSSSGRFGRSGSTDTKTDDKSAGGRFGRGGSTDTKTADKSSSSGRFGSSGTTTTKKDDKTSIGGGITSRFRRGGDDKKDNKGGKAATPSGRFGSSPSDAKAKPKGEKLGSGGGLLGRFRAKNEQQTRAKPGDKKALPTEQRVPKNVTGGLDLDRKLDIMGFILLAVALFTFAGWLQAQTATDPNVAGATVKFDKFLAQTFGDGRLVIPIVSAYLGGWLVLRYFGRMFNIDYWRIAGYAMLYSGLLTTLHWWQLLFEEFPSKINYVPTFEALRLESQQLWEGGGGGGIIGHELYMIFESLFGDYMIVGIFFVWWGIGLYFGFGVTFERIANYIIDKRSAREAQRKAKPVQQPATSPAPVGATAVATQSSGPARRLFGRGRKEAPSDAPITADTDGSQPSRAPAVAVATTPGRVEAPTNAPITADTDGNQPKRRLGGLIGRKKAPEPVAETVAGVATAASVTQKEAEKPKRALFGRSGRQEDTGQIATTSTEGEVAASTRKPKEDDSSEKASGRKLPFGGRKVEDATSAPIPVVTSPTEHATLVAEDTGRRPVTTTEQPSGGRRTAPPTPVASPSATTPTSSQEPIAEPVVASAPIEATPPAELPGRRTPAPSSPFGRKSETATSTTTNGDQVAETSRASDLQPNVKPPTVETVPTGNGKPAEAEEKKEITPEAVVAGAAMVASATISNPTSEKSDSAVASMTSPSTTETKDSDAEALVTARPRGIFKRDDNEPSSPSSRTITPAPKPVPPPLSVNADNEDDEDEGEIIPSTKPRGLSESAVAAVAAAASKDTTKKEEKPVEVVSKAEQAAHELKAAEAAITEGRWRHPDYLKLLEEGSELKIEQQILLDRARVIEDTLESFGAPGKVVEVNTGPVITQFGVEPDYIERRGGHRSRVKVSAIASLEKDISLALAAKAIRIEAPVPGKGYVGIEVPNAEASVVSLRDIMMSDEHQKQLRKSRLAIGLGRRVDGSPVTADLTQMPHLLVAGATGSGKSVCVNAIISCLLLQNTPEELQFIMVDPKRVELAGYNGIPHLVSPVVVDLERIVGVLKWVQREMDDRYRRFAAVGARNIIDFNDNKLPSGTDRLPYLVVVVDELADLMMLAPDETERLIARLAQMARATGIHLIISTQRPSVDVVTGLIKANFPARIAFAVASSVDSRVIIDQPGAEKLLGRGDMLFQAPDAPAPLRMQGAFLSDPEINRITHYWKSIQALKDKTGVKISSGLSATEAQNLPTVQSRADRFNVPSSSDASTSSAATDMRRPSNPQQRFWESQSGESKPNAADGEDELYEKAVELVRQQNKASIAMLQRNFRIGYDRANRLMQILEEKGVVAAEEEGSILRKVLPAKE